MPARLREASPDPTVQSRPQASGGRPHLGPAPPTSGRPAHTRPPRPAPHWSPGEAGGRAGGSSGAAWPGPLPGPCLLQLGRPHPRPGSRSTQTTPQWSPGAGSFTQLAWKDPCHGGLAGGGWDCQHPLGSPLPPTAPAKALAPGPQQLFRGLRHVGWVGALQPQGVGAKPASTGHSCPSAQVPPGPGPLPPSCLAATRSVQDTWALCSRAHRAPHPQVPSWPPAPHRAKSRSHSGPLPENGGVRPWGGEAGWAGRSAWAPRVWGGGPPGRLALLGATGGVRAASELSRAAPGPGPCCPGPGHPGFTWETQC